jgi:predicted amidohydrolase YtcJ
VSPDLSPLAAPVLLLGLAGLLASCREAPPEPPLLDSGARVLIHGGTIHTGDPAQPEVEALVLEHGRVVVAGSRADAEVYREGAEMIDLAGATVTPGLIDAHLHLEGIGWREIRLDVTGTASLAEVQEALRRYAEANPGASWLRGRGWDQNDWPETAWPTAADLDAVVADRPVALSRIDGHALWVNSAALEAAGITAATRDPEGGRLIRDESGAPTGILVDRAEELVEEVIPTASRERRKEALLAGARACARSGLTMVHDMGVDREGLEIYRGLAAEGALPVRVLAYIGGPGELLDEYLERGPETGPRLAVRGVKLYADGALGSRGAALLEDYSDEEGNRGLVVTPIEEIRAITEACLRSGLQVATHAIGDRANRLVLDAYAQALEAVPEARDPRLRVEHAQILHPDDLARFAGLGVIASMQPTHATSDAPWAGRRLGESRLVGAYAWRSLREEGALLAFGSDAPVESERPALGLLAAVTRQDPEGRPPGGFLPEQRLTALEALAAFTRGAAYASYDESRLGMLRVGFAADLVLWPADPLEAAPTELAGLAPLRVISAGRTVFRAEEAP